MHAQIPGPEREAKDESCGRDRAKDAWWLARCDGRGKPFLPAQPSSDHSADLFHVLSAVFRALLLLEMRSGRHNPSAEMRAIENDCRIFLSPQGVAENAPVQVWDLGESSQQICHIWLGVVVNYISAVSLKASK